MIVFASKVLALGGLEVAIIAVMGIALVAMAVLLARKSSQKDKKLEGRTVDQPALEGSRTVKNLQVNDIVEYIGQQFIVKGMLTYNESGWIWHEYMLADGDDVRYLSVEEDDEVEVGIFEEVDDIDVDGPPPKELTYRGQHYKRVEKGRAEMLKEGDTGKKSGKYCNFFEYEGPDDQALSIEQWGQNFDVFYGKEIDEDLLEFFPGDLVT